MPSFTKEVVGLGQVLVEEGILKFKDLNQS